MRIDIWSDIACPFCYIGKRRLEEALAKTDTKAEVIWHSFELDQTPRAARPTTDVVSALMQKYGQSRSQTEAMLTQVSEMGRGAGLDLRLRDSVRANTFDAHRLLHLAAEHGVQGAAKERLLRAYFTEAADMEDHDTLCRLLAEVGVPAADAAAVLSSDAYAAEVRRDEQQAMQIGIRGVPFFVFNQTHAVSGAQPVAVFQRAMADSQPAPAPAAADGPSCEADRCDV